MTGMASCIECGEVTELLLAPRFPHICHECLFPPGRPEDPTADPPSLTVLTTNDIPVTKSLQPVSLVAKLLRFSSNGSFYAHTFPEYYSPTKPRSDAE